MASTIAQWICNLFLQLYWWCRSATTKYRLLEINSFFYTMKGIRYINNFFSLLCWELFTNRNWSAEWCISKHWALLRQQNLQILSNAKQKVELGSCLHLSVWTHKKDKLRSKSVWWFSGELTDSSNQRSTFKSILF